MQFFAVVGHPLQHTLSPALHRLVFQAWGLEGAYLPWEILRPELPAAVQMFRRNLAGFNVTAPYKKEIVPYLDRLDLSAEIFGAVNTVKNEAGRLIGYNTDGEGFMRGLHHAAYNAAKKHVLLIGAGGAAQTVALELARLGCVLTLANREVENAYWLKLLVESRFPTADAEVCSLERIPKQDYKVIINATPVGMGALEGRSPLAREFLAGAELVYDLIYNPPQSKLLHQAAQAGCLTINGLAMLAYQGLRAQEIWQGRRAAPELEANIMAAMAKEVVR